MTWLESRSPDGERNDTYDNLWSEVGDLRADDDVITIFVSLNILHLNVLHPDIRSL